MANMNDQWGMGPMWNEMMNQGPADYYEGNTVAGFTPMQQQGWDASMQGANNMAGAGNQMMNQYGQGPQDVKLGGGMDMFNNPYLQQSIQAGMQQNNQNFDRNVMPGISQGATGSGMSGSSKQGIAQGLAASDLNQQNLNMASQMNQQAYDQGMQNHLAQRGQNLQTLQGNQQNQTNWMGMGGDMMNMYGASQMAPGNMMSQIGGQQQGMNQSQMDADKARWDYNQNKNWMQLERGANTLGGLMGQYGETN